MRIDGYFDAYAQAIDAHGLRQAACELGRFCRCQSDGARTACANHVVHAHTCPCVWATPQIRTALEDEVLACVAHE